MSPPPKSPPRRPPPAQATEPQQKVSKSFSVGPNSSTRGERIVLYGEGGIGKTTLAAKAPEPVFLNFDRNPHLPEGALEVHGVTSFADALLALRSEDLWTKAETVVVDTATAAQDLAIEHVIANIPHEKGSKVSSIEGYGYGKGYRHLYDAMIELVAAVDRHAELGRHVIIVCHDLAASVPNPDGDDFLQYQPNLINNGKTCLVRDRIKGWCDHLLFLKYDIAVSEDGKATGSGSRTIWPQASATYWAKSRTLRDPIVFVEDDSEVWDTLFNHGR